jgi:N-glycosylase/DNA lyase
MNETGKYELAKSATKLKIKHVADFDPDQVFDCGQCFRWRKDLNSDQIIWYGVVGEDFARLVYDKTDDNVGDITIESYNNDEKFWTKYLDLDRDYSSIKHELSEKDGVLKKAIEVGSGIRIMGQDEWETLISFIISQNSNIPRIRGCIETICREYGREIGEYNGEKMFTFPSFKTMSTLKEEDLKLCRLGYRAKYIAEASRQIAADDGAVLEVAYKMKDSDVLNYLLSISGIGPKVASCIMLFSMGKLNIFPIDVWVKRVMNQLYGIDEGNLVAMKTYAEEHFGKYGGIAQQYLFYYIRKDDEQ